MRTILIAPYSYHYRQDKLFDRNDAKLNPDYAAECLERLRADAARIGSTIHTDDFLPRLIDENSNRSIDYYSMGILQDFSAIASQPNIRMKAFVFYEPPVVAPKIYKALPELTAIFDQVYIPNTEGDGYSLQGVNKDKLRPLYWPIPFREVLMPYWSQKERQRKVVVINSNRRPRKNKREYYSTRIEATAYLAGIDAIDLYGRGWDRSLWAKESRWWPYWRHHSALQKVYKGPCPSKWDVLSKYEFCLCFENNPMAGYVTEKLFHCLYAGTIPLYLGAPDITSIIPPSCYIDCRRFSNWAEMWEYTKNLSTSEIDDMRNAGRDFLTSTQSKRFYYSLNEIFDIAAE